MPRLSAASLGLKLNLSLFFFVLLLGSATASFILYGFQRTQDNATQRSREGLEEIGRQQVQTIASDQSDLGAFQLQWAADASQLAARYLVELKRNGGAVPFDASRLTRTAEGVLYDPDPDRTTDLAMPNFAALSAAALQDISDTAAFDALFPAILASYPGQLRAQNFDAIAVTFTSVNQVTRYYPPIGVHDIAAPDTDVSPTLNRLGPLNRERLTIWSVPYEDAAGQGLVITANTPVYDGDTYLGVIGIDLSITRLVATIDQVSPTQFGFAFYIDNNGKLLESDSFDAIQEELARGNEQLRAVMQAMRRGEESVARVNVAGRDMFVGFAPLAGVGGSLAVVASVDELTAQAAAITSSIEEEGNRTLTITLLAMLAIFLVGLAGETWLNRRFILEPIEALVDGTRRVARGDLDTTIPVAGDDELGILATSFNMMTTEMRGRRDALEREVKERTEAQDELRALFAAMTDTVVVIDKEGRYLRVPITNAPDYLLAQQDLPGKTMWEVMPDAQANGLIVPLRKAIESQETQTIEYPLEIDDRTLWFSAAISPISTEAVLVVARDITDRIEAHLELERRVEERTRELNTVLDVSHNLVATLDLNELLQVILEQTEKVCDYSRVSLYLHDREGYMALLASRVPGGNPAKMPPSFRLKLDLMGQTWDLIAGPEPAIVDDVRDDSEAAANLRNAAGSMSIYESATSGDHSWMGVPLLLQDRVVGLLALTHAEVGYFTRHHYELVQAIANQAAIAIENAKLYESAQLLAAVEERQKLARELHDSVSQALYGIALGARTARTQLDRDPLKAIEPVEYVLQLAEAGLAEMRALIFELRPESLEIEGLVAALQKQVAATSARYGIKVSGDLDPEPDLSLTNKEVFYRIAQEALHNVVKHAKASEATIRLKNNGDVTLEVSDNGIGFDSSASFPGHMGLVSMSERAANIGATIAVESRPGEGTTIRLTLSR